MMYDRLLLRTEWKAYFDQVEKILIGELIEVEVLGLDLGAQIEARDEPFEGFSYDPKDDVFYIHSTRLDHQVAHPRSIIVTESGPSLRTVAIEDHHGHIHLVKVREPLRLPPP